MNSEYRTTFKISAKPQKGKVKVGVTDKNDGQTPEFCQLTVTGLLFLCGIVAKKTFIDIQQSNQIFENGYTCEVDLVFKDKGNDRLDVQVSSDGIISALFCKCIQLFLEKDPEFLAEFELS